MRKRSLLGPCRRPMPRVLWGSLGGGLFFMGDVPLHPRQALHKGVNVFASEWVLGFGFRVGGFGFRVSKSGFRILGVGYRAGEGAEKEVPRIACRERRLARALALALKRGTPYKVCLKNGSSQGQNLALTVLYVPSSLDSGPETLNSKTGPDASQMSQP